MPEVEVAPARPEEKPVLANLMQLYIHDFSEFWAGTAEGEIQEDGRFPDYPLESYWRDPSRIPLLFRIDGAPVGFALLNAVGHGRWPVERNMAEFFIVRKHRRGGVGTAGARQVFTLYPGDWEVAVARKNVGALAFWRQAIGGHSQVRDVEELDLATVIWNGPLFRFGIRET